MDVKIKTLIINNFKEIKRKAVRIMELNNTIENLLQERLILIKEMTMLRVELEVEDILKKVRPDLAEEIDTLFEISINKEGFLIGKEIEGIKEGEEQ
jgi:hypothetical protein